MSESAEPEPVETDAEPADKQDDPQDAEPADDEKPAIDDDEKPAIDFDDIDPAEIEAETNPDADDSDQDSDDGDEPEPEPAPTPSGESWGDMYVSGLVGVSNTNREEYGDGGTVDESLAYQIELDERFDEFLNEQGVGEDMPPGQAVLVGSSIFLLMSLGTDSELLGEVMNEVDL